MTESQSSTRVALDSNVILGGLRGEIAAAAYLGYYQGIWSSWIVGEVVRKRTEWIGERAVREGADVAETMRRFETSRERVNRLIDELSEAFASVDYREAPAGEDLTWLTDPDDKAVMQTALAGRADILVTEDTDFPMGEKRNGIQFLTARAFLAWLYDTYPEAEEDVRSYLGR